MTTEDFVQDYRRIVAGQVGIENLPETGDVKLSLGTTTPPHRVWLLWRNDQVLGVLGSYDRAWEELHELMASIGGVWTPAPGSKHLRWWSDMTARVEIEPREVVG